MSNTGKVKHSIIAIVLPSDHIIIAIVMPSDHSIVANNGFTSTCKCRACMCMCICQYIFGKWEIYEIVIQWNFPI